MKQLPLVSITIQAIEQEGCGLAAFRTSLGDLTKLKESIKTTGLMTPPTVWHAMSENGEHFVVIDGNRRVAAVTELRQEWNAKRGSFPLEQITVAVFKGTLEQARRLSALAHLQSPQHTRGDVSAAVVWLLETMTEDVVAGLVGQSQAWVSQCRKYVKRLSPEAFAALRRGDIDKTVADRLAEMRTDDGRPDLVSQNAHVCECTRPPERRGYAHILAYLASDPDCEMTAAEIWQAQTGDGRSSASTIDKALHRLEAEGKVVRFADDGRVYWSISDV